MAWDAHSNFAKGTLTNSPGTAGTSFVLGSGEGALFAANTPVTLVPDQTQPDSSNSEIGYVTGVSTDTLTVTRTQQGSNNQDVQAGWLVLGTITTKALTDIEAEVDTKQDIITGLTASGAELNILDGATLTTTELNYVDGVTSAIQTQIDTKAPIASPTFTGTVSGVSKSMVGLGNVDNTADTAKPVSTAQQTALDLKANLASPTFTGTVTLPSGQALIAPALGTPASGTLTNTTGLPIAGLVASTATAIGVGSIELGHASDTTLTRASAGNVSIEGNAIYRAGGTDVPVADGGTGRSTSTTAYGLIAAGTTATGAHQTLAAGATTEILVGGGASALPVWTTAQGSGAPVRATSPTITTPVLSGSVTGTYTLAGTPTLTSPTINTPTITWTNNTVTAAALATSAIKLGTTSVTSSFSTASTTAVQVTSLSLTATVPAGGRDVELNINARSWKNSNSLAYNTLTLWEGTVGSGTKLYEWVQQVPIAGGESPVSFTHSYTPTSGSKTWNVSLHTNAGTAEISQISGIPIKLTAKNI